MEFQLWKLTVQADRSARLICEDGNGGVVFSKAIDYTDFPLPENHIVLPCSGFSGRTRFRIKPDSSG